MPDVIARQDARDLVRMLEPACQRIAVAGSVRRQAARVKDIDLVLIPRTEAAAGELFDAHEADALEARIAALIQLPRSYLARPRDARNGPRHKELTFRNRRVELWIVRPPATWGVIFALRTGDADFSRLLVTPSGKGGALPPDHCVSAGRLLHAHREVATREEADFFRALGLPTFPPERRTAEELRTWMERRHYDL